MAKIIHIPTNTIVWSHVTLKQAKDEVIILNATFPKQYKALA